MSTLAIEARAVRLMLVAVWRERAHKGSNWLTWFLLALAAIFPLAAGTTSGKWAISIGLGMALPLAALGLLWWTLLMSGLSGQVRARSAPLVPGLQRRARTLAALVFVLGVAGMAGLLALAGVRPWVTAIGTAVALDFMLVLIAFPRLAILGAWLILYFLFKDWLPALSLPLDAATLLAGGAALAALGTPWLLRRVLRARSGQPLRAPASLRGGRWYRFSLRRDSARRDSASLLRHALGPRAHYGAHALSLLTVTVIGLALATLAGQHLALSPVWLRAGIACLLLYSQLLVVELLWGAVYAKAGEQALVRLTPAAPAAGAFNGVFGTVLLRQFGAWWIMSSLLIAGLNLRLGGNWAEVLRLLAVCCLNLAAAGLLLRPYAVQRVLARSVERWAMPLILLDTVAGSLALSDRYGSAAWAALALAGLAAGVAVIAWRRRVFATAPPVFPAGRLQASRQGA